MNSATSLPGVSESSSLMTMGTVVNTSKKRETAEPLALETGAALAWSAEPTVGSVAFAEPLVLGLLMMMLTGAANAALVTWTSAGLPIAGAEASVTVTPTVEL